jgi:hypothetical protein
MLLSNGLVLSSDLACLARNLFHFVLISIITNKEEQKKKNQWVKTFDKTFDNTDSHHRTTYPPIYE